VLNVALPEVGVEGAVVEDMCEAWIKQAFALSTEVVDVMTDIGIGPHDTYVSWNEVFHQGCRSSFADYA
jgi:hypothetical protein